MRKHLNLFNGIVCLVIVFAVFVVFNWMAQRDLTPYILADDGKKILNPSNVYEGEILSIENSTTYNRAVISLTKNKKVFMVYQLVSTELKGARVCVVEVYLNQSNTDYYILQTEICPEVIHPKK